MLVFTKCVTLEIVKFSEFYFPQLQNKDSTTGLNGLLRGENEIIF